MVSIPRLGGGTAATIMAGLLVGVPGTIGLVLNSQISRARRHNFLPSPAYRVDLQVNPPWADGPPLSIAFLGDSLVEGVGAPLAVDSLPAQTAYRLSAHLGRPITMRGFGVASSRIEHVLAQQVPQLTPEFDLVLVLIGANDATHATSPWDFARRMALLTLHASERTGGAPIVFTGLPELESAPLLARPLRNLAGVAGDTLHVIQRRLALRLPQARYIDVRYEVAEIIRRRGAELFASDCYHPNPSGYAVMGEGIARSLARMLTLECGQDQPPAVCGSTVGTEKLALVA